MWIIVFAAALALGIGLRWLFFSLGVPAWMM